MLPPPDRLARLVLMPQTHAMDHAKRQIVEQVCVSSIVGARPLHGGCVGEVILIELADGRRVVAKLASHGMDREGWMLGFLAECTSAAGHPLPVPGVLHAEPTMLLMEHIEHDGLATHASEHEAALHLAHLHEITATRFGLERTTPIGGLPQDNTPESDWGGFYARRRLLPMAELAHSRGHLTLAQRDLIGELAGQIEAVLEASGYDPHHPGARPRLIHGDIWAGNVLWHNGKVAAFIDPALVYADAELELAFIDLFGTFGNAFSEAYRAVHPARSGYEPIRRTLYQVYPLLVHAALFAGGYADQAVRAAQACLRHAR